MSRIGIILRGALRWLGKRLPTRIQRLFVRREPEIPAPLTMAESRKQALAAWEHLVSEHAPHLLRESVHERSAETALQWPRMEPFESSRARAWPAHPAQHQALSLHREQRRPAPAGESRSSWARSAGAQTPDSGGNTQPVADPGPQPNGEQAGMDPLVRHSRVEAAPGPKHRGWQRAVSGATDFVRSSHTTWTTEASGSRAFPPCGAIPESDPGVRNRAASPESEPAISQRRYDSPVFQPPHSYRAGPSVDTTTPAAGFRHRSSPWLETAIPEDSQPGYEHGIAEPAPQCSSDHPWAELPDGPLHSPSGQPRAASTEADRRQRLLDEQRGVL